MTDLFTQSAINYENFIVRPLHLEDYNKGFLDVLALLTGVGKVSFDQFEKTFNEMKSGKMHYIYVATNLEDTEILATGCLGIEQKFIRNCALKGRVEDVISKGTNFTERDDMDNAIMKAICEKAAELKCYKMSLESLDAHLNFYEDFGFKVDKELEMVNRHIVHKDNTETRFDDFKSK